MKDFITQHYIL